MRREFTMSHSKFTISDTSVSKATPWYKYQQQIAPNICSGEEKDSNKKEDHSSAEKKRRTRCGECSPCLGEDCLTCKYCVDKTKVERALVISEKSGL